MSFAPSTPVTGATVPGFTTPTYTIVADTPPNINGKQYAVSALGGTQTGVDVNSVSKPFTVAFFRPQSLKTLPAANPTTGIIRSIPVNSYKFVTRKGAVPATNQTTQVARITTTIDVPAGTDTFEPEEIKAMLSAHIGTLNQQSSGIADTVITGVL
jgi:hypothetical protein